jgi:hypothetical protein
LIPIGPTLGVLERGNRVVAYLQNVKGSARAVPNKGLVNSFTAEIIGRPGYWCEPGVDLRLTFATRPKLKKSPRLSTLVTVKALDGAIISLGGSDEWHSEIYYAGPLSPEVIP